MKVPELDRRKQELDEVVLQKEGNIIYVDFVLVSVVNAIDDWYKKYYQGDDGFGTRRKAHMHHAIRFYDPMKFRDYKNLEKERDKLLKELDEYIQMRRDD